MTKRYWLFAGETYYPSGGMEDLRGKYDTMVEAVKAIKRADWFHVLDTKTDRVYNHYEVPNDVRIVEWAESFDKVI